MKKHIKKLVVIIVMIIAMGLATIYQTKAMPQLGIIEIIKAVTVKVIKAMDLKIQQLQNKTIWLQNTQKTLENTLSKMKLKEIANWQEKQKEQYRKYYEELSKVKGTISTYQRIRDATQKQARLVTEYQRVWQLLRQDDHFTKDEVGYMGKVYSGILDESLKNVNQIRLVVTSFATQMSDAKRLELVNHAADEVDQNYDDLTRFNNENKALSMQRAKSQREIDQLKGLYGID